MKQLNTPARGKAPAKAKRKSREELNQESRAQKKDRKHRGNPSGSRATGASSSQGQGKGNKQTIDSRIGSKKPIPLGVTEPVTVAPKKQQQPKREKPMLTPQAELDLLENDERLDGLLERLEAGETLNAEERSWVDAKLDRIDALMQELGLSYDDDEEEDEREDDLMRLLKGGN